MWGQRVLALSLGSFLACALVALGIFLSAPKQIVRMFTGVHVPFDLPLGSYSIHYPCAGQDSSLLVPVSAWSHPLVEPMVEHKTGRGRMSASARYSGHWFESRCVSFQLSPGRVRVEARFDTDCGVFPGIIDTEKSHVRSDGDRICFDLILQREDGSKSLERWEGEIALQ